MCEHQARVCATLGRPQAVQAHVVANVLGYDGAPRGRGERQEVSVGDAPQAGIENHSDDVVPALRQCFGDEVRVHLVEEELHLANSSSCRRKARSSVSANSWRCADAASISAVKSA